MLAALWLGVAVLIATAGSARNACAQDAPNPAPGPFLPGQARQHYVPQHFTRDGKFVPGHFETTRRAPFQGHFADKEARRKGNALHGYHEPAPDYETPPGPEKRMEGR